MKIAYDKKQDAVYFKLGSGKHKTTKKVNESILIDYDAEGSILGIEVLDASINISQFDIKKMTISLQ
jgi:uncharacterized protein YuzE